MPNDDRRFDPQYLDSLLGAERQAHWDPFRLLERAGLGAGQTALDLGCGPGFWALPMAHIVGTSGQVIALDVSREMLDALAARNPPAHIRLMQSELPAINLPDSSVDFIWTAFVFHEVEPPSALAAEMHRVLRPGGRLAVLDWRPDASSESGPPRHHRLSPEQVQQFLLPAGFAQINQIWQDKDAYLVSAE